MVNSLTTSVAQYSETWKRVRVGVLSSGFTDTFVRYRHVATELGRLLSR